MDPNGRRRAASSFAQRRTLEQDRPHRFLAALALFTPMLVFIEVGIIGRLFLTEVVFLGALPFLLLFRGRMLFQPLPRIFLMLAVAWLLAQMVTDIVRDTPFVDYSRGWAKITFTILNFCAIYLLVYGSRQRILLLAVGLVVGGFLSYFLNPNIFAESDPWKFGVGYPLTLLVAVLASWGPIARIWAMPAAMALSMGVFNIAMGSRSLGLVTLLTGLYLLVQAIAGRRNRPMVRPSPARVVIAFIGGVFIVGLVAESYELAAKGGLLGFDAKQTYERQSQGKYGVLLGGRSEIYVSAQAIADSPLIGHGSWAKNPRYAERILELRDYGYQVNTLVAEGDLIPTHSHFFGAWVEAGITGAIFWGWVLWLVIRVLASMWAVREPIAALIAFVGFMMLWDILFSPFGAERRITNAYFIALMIFIWAVLKSGNFPAESQRMRNRHSASYGPHVS